MKRISIQSTTPVLEYLAIGSSAVLFALPWVAGFSGQGSAAWNMWAAAFISAALAVSSLATLNRWWGWAITALAAWLIVSPWALAFTPHGAALWSHTTVGFVLAAIGVLAGVSGRIVNQAAAA